MASSTGRSPVRRAFVSAEEGRLRAGWRLLLGAVAFVLTLLVASLGSGLVLGAVAGAVAPTVVQYVAQTVWNVLLTVTLVGLALVVDRRTLPDLGLGGRGLWPNLAFGLALGVVMTASVVAVELAAGWLVVAETVATHPVGGDGPTLSFGVGIALTVLLFLAVGVGEEVFSRGYLMTNLAEGVDGLGPLGPRAAIGLAALATSALFGVLHAANPNATPLSIVNITVVGLFFAATYVATGDLGVPIGVHVTWNLSLGALWGLPVSGTRLPASLLVLEPTGPRLLTGGAFGPEGGLLLYVALAVGVGLTWLWVRHREGAVRFHADVAVPDLRASADDRDGPSAGESNRGG